MKITKFWAKGFRSLRDVTLEGLGDFNVFYGPNGSGKSNVLAAMQMLVDLLGVVAATAEEHRFQSFIGGDFARTAGQHARARGILLDRDLNVLDRSKTCTLGAEFGAFEVDEAVDLRLSTDREIHQTIKIEVSADWHIPGDPRMALTAFEADGTRFDGDDLEHQAYAEFLAFLSRLSSEAYALVDADRAPRRELDSPNAAAPPDAGRAMAWHLRHGHLKTVLFDAQNSPDASTRLRSKALRAFLEGPPLARPPFDVTRDPATLEIDVREPLGSGDVSIDLVGLGVAQIYALLAGVLLVEARSVGIEEPEAHLHAPTTGRHLRAVLQRVVVEHFKRQLFIATHSNLFDLDPSGYWDVSLRDGATHVERRELTDLDAEHLYEPGPAKRALEAQLRYMPADEVVFRRPDGTPVTALEMLDLLAKDDDAALRFLRTIDGAVLRMVKLEARRSAEGK